MTWTSLILNVVTAVGGLAGISALFNVLLSRKKSNMETADIEQNISDKILKNVNSDNEMLRTEREQSKKDLQSLRTENVDIQNRLMLCESNQFYTKVLVNKLIEWAKEASVELKALGSDKEDPPTVELINRIKL